MKEYPNFYENLQEASRRLRSTVIMYDGFPMFLFALANHKNDGIFRAYLLPLGSKVPLSIPPSYIGGSEYGANGEALDQWMNDNPDSGMIRKMLNSPKFNKFRPFKLGMCNWRTGKTAQAFYCMRQPVRNKEQGLTDRMVMYLPIKVTLDEITSQQTPSGGRKMRVTISPQPQINSVPFTSCVLGKHPSLDTVIENLNDDSIVNASAAFHREFAVARGPVGSLFLVYRQNVVGLLPNNDKSRLIVDERFRHTIDAIAELEQFENITTKAC